MEKKIMEIILHPIILHLLQLLLHHLHLLLLRVAVAKH
jgi:hypothetical protein